MARQQAREQGQWRLRDEPRHRGERSGARGRRPRRAVIVVAVPLALSAVVASAYALVPRVTTTPAALETPVVRVESQALTADPAVGSQQQPAAPPSAAPTVPVAAPTAPAGNQPEHGRIRLVKQYKKSSVDRIPSASLAAYQRAELVMHVALSRCRLDWTVLAGVAKVESNHGRAGGNRVTDQGVSRPGVFGKPLNGRGGRARMRDTDAGSVDDNRRWDAPAGPMGLLPSTWTVVAVDSDGDGNRNLQDVDDAALGVGVFVCSGDRDLSKRREVRAALRSLNPTPGYARLVMSLARSYRNDGAATPTLPPPWIGLGDIPDGLVRSVTTTLVTDDPRPNGPPGGDQNDDAAQHPSEPAQPNPPPSGSPEPAPGPSEGEPPTGETPAPPPADPPESEPPTEETPAPPPADPPESEPPTEETPAPPPADPPESEPPTEETPEPVPTDPPESVPPTEENPAPADPPESEPAPAGTPGQDSTGTTP